MSQNFPKHTYIIRLYFHILVTVDYTSFQIVRERRHHSRRNSYFGIGLGLRHCKGEMFLKVDFFGVISTTFEFSRQNDIQFFAEIDISACQIWLKMKFCLFEVVKKPSF